MPQDESSATDATANPGYAASQIAKAYLTFATHSDAATRDRARAKVEKWARVLKGMMSGELATGARQPMQDVPVWVTLEVVTGGFATGQLLANGPLQPHENEQLQRVAPPAAAGTERSTLNAHALSQAGFLELSKRLQSGRYDIEVPEEGALLVATWLAMNGHAEVASDLIEALSPYFATLRFYPRPAERSQIAGTRVHLETAGEALQRVRNIQPNPRILAEREAIQFWGPLYEGMIGLFAETVSGESPAICPDAQGRWVSAATRRFNVTGGWPCLRFAADWRERARRLADDIDGALARRSRHGKQQAEGSSFAKLHDYLKRCAQDPGSLTGRDVGMIRLILARHFTLRGTPGSERSKTFHAEQARQVDGPTHHQIAEVLVRRLSQHPPESGLDEIETIIQPVAIDQTSLSATSTGTPVPPSMARKVRRCLLDTVDALVEKDIITSGDTLARVIPQFSGHLQAGSFDDPQLRLLYAAIYRAFRKRRSLLLLNLEKQIRIVELPWVSVLAPYRRKDQSTRDTSRTALKESMALTLRAFPHAIIPNKLLQEFRALAKAAELDLPLVEELAADIFMGEFSPKFTAAAKRATRLMNGTLYARYFGIDCTEVLNLPEALPKSGRNWFQQSTPARPNPLVALCVTRAGVDPQPGWDVVRNGMIIEQAQILTTQNLALAFETFDLAELLGGELRDMSERCFRWICRRQQAKAHGHAELIMLKNTAYAWRQMIFFLSFLPPGETHQFLGWAGDHLREQDAPFAARFTPALAELESATDSLAPAAPPARRGRFKCFLGWTKGRHWILGG